MTTPTLNDRITMFNESTCRTIRKIVFQPDYPGYKPEVVEAPNGDGKLDTGKRYAHIATKYRHPNAGLQHYLDRVFWNAFEQADLAHLWSGLPSEFAPDPRYCALRVLEYPPGVGSEKHTDFDIFTLNLWRSGPGLVIGDALITYFEDRFSMHTGEIWQEITGTRALPHWVEPQDTWQYSMVFFAIPDHAARLPSGVQVGEWITERIARSRYK